MLSLNKLHGSGRSSYVVSCELPDGNDHHVLRSKKFECRGVEDLGAQANAVRFAKAAETVPEFRAFLFGSETDGFGRDQRIRVRSYVCMREKQLTGVRYGVAMCRLESGQLRSISFFRGTASDEVAGAKGEKQVLEKAEQFLRSVAFENWRRQGSRESLLKNREQAAGSTHNLGKERGLKHPHSFVEIDQGEKVDCKCGKNRSHGLMMACERCGAWEHAECQGFRSDKQVVVPRQCSPMPLSSLFCQERRCSDSWTAVSTLVYEPMLGLHQGLYQELGMFYRGRYMCPPIQEARASEHCFV